MDNLTEFLKHSNYIENEYSQQAFEDAELAWDYAYKNRHNINISIILGIHNRLMRRLNCRIAGKFRNCDVWIGGNLRRFISELCFRERLKQVLFMTKLIDQTKSDNYKIEKIKKLHIDFEEIHPFEDGNGRVGRILYNINRLNNGLDLHIIHKGKEQMEYYKWFK